MTLDELRDLWAQRDYRYGLRRQAVSPAEIEQARRWRQAEAERLPRPVRAGAYLEAGRWTPPTRWTPLARQGRVGA